jgi:hypothetical protein
MRKRSILVPAVAAIAVTAAAFAGPHVTAFVSVIKSGNGGSAYGSMWSARSESADNNQFIGCTVGSIPKHPNTISCLANNAAGVPLICVSDSPDEQTRKAVSSINPSSYIYFQVDSLERCTYITVSNYSYAQ